jgi:2-oxoisovalerate dehydrogenase E1 component alpha subunit
MSSSLVTLDAFIREDDRFDESPPPVQLVRPDGSLTELGETIGVDADLARGLYRDMVLGRRLDHEALALQRQGELGLWLMSWGQEAAQAGSIRALRDTDMVFPSYREHVAALCRGITPAQLMTQWRGIRHSGWDPKQSQFHIYSLVLGHQTLHGTGYAAGVKLDGASDVVAVYFGDGAASQGDVSEALNWAAAASLPVLFFCQNNQWAISTPTRLQMRTPLYRRAAGFGLRAYHVDGNDALAVHTVTTLAAEKIRDGEGPAFIEAQTYRLAGHSSSDDPKRYRDAAEFELWRSRDPIARLEVVLRDIGVADQWFTELKTEADDLGAHVREACKAQQPQDLSDMFDWVYCEPHSLIEADKRALAVARTAEA